MNKQIADLPKIVPEKIEKLQDLDVLFIRKVGEYSKSGVEAWTSMHAFINENHLDKVFLRYFGIAHDDPHITAEDNLRYDACILSQKTILLKDNVGKQTIRGGRYAIFLHQGAYAAIDVTYDRIFFKWLPDSQEHIDETRPCFAEYFNIEFVKTDPNQLVTKIYIPII